MSIIVCLTLVTLISYFFSDFIKKYNAYVYIAVSTLSIIAIIHAILILNGNTINYVVGLKQLMKAIDSGALGGSLFILVMYMGVFDMKKMYARKLRAIRAELSIIACIFTFPHNVHYLFAFLLNSKTIVQMRSFSLWTNLMMFTAGVFAILIMIPLFITSFRYFRKKMSGKAWKNLQEYAYIFYAMVFVQVMMVYLGRPSGFIRNLNLVFYFGIFSSYTFLKIRLILEKRKNSVKRLSSNNTTL